MDPPRAVGTFGLSGRKLQLPRAGDRLDRPRRSTMGPAGGARAPNESWVAQPLPYPPEVRPSSSFVEAKQGEIRGTFKGGVEGVDQCKKGTFWRTQAQALKLL